MVPKNAAVNATTGEGATLPVLSQDTDVRIRLVPHVSFMTHCYVFDTIDRTLSPGIVLRLGRYNNNKQNCLSFKSKVVSRSHAEIWCDKGKIYIRDVGSSSGTFINRARLPSASKREIKDGDVIQLGVDYQGGVEPMYRAVRIRVQVGYSTENNRLRTETAFQQRLLLTDEECSICLYPMAPRQALFVAPCSHVYHFKCLRPLLEQHYPAFACPLCRTYSNLDECVNTAPEEDEEEEEVKSPVDTIASSRLLPETSSSSSSRDTVILQKHLEAATTVSSLDMTSLSLV